MEELFGWPYRRLMIMVKLALFTILSLICSAWNLHQRWRYHGLPPHLNCAATLPCEILMMSLCCSGWCCSDSCVPADRQHCSSSTSAIIICCRQSSTGAGGKDWAMSIVIWMITELDNQKVVSLTLGLDCCHVVTAWMGYCLWTG